MADRRRVNGPVGATFAPVFAREERAKVAKVAKVSERSRPNDIIRKICMQRTTRFDQK